MGNVKVYLNTCIFYVFIFGGIKLTTGLQCYFCIHYETTVDIPQPGLPSQQTCKDGSKPNSMFLTNCDNSNTSYIRYSNRTNTPVEFVNDDEVGEEQPRFTWTCGKFTMNGQINNASFIGILRSCVWQLETETGPVTGCDQKSLGQLEGDEPLVKQYMDYFRSRNITLSPESIMGGCTCKEDKCNSYVKPTPTTSRATSLWELPVFGVLWASIGTLISYLEYQQK